MEEIKHIITITNNWHTADCGWEETVDELDEEVQAIKTRISHMHGDASPKDHTRAMPLCMCNWEWTLYQFLPFTSANENEALAGAKTITIIDNANPMSTLLGAQSLCATLFVLLLPIRLFTLYSPWLLSLCSKCAEAYCEWWTMELYNELWREFTRTYRRKWTSG